MALPLLPSAAAAAASSARCPLLSWACHRLPLGPVLASLSGPRVLGHANGAWRRERAALSSSKPSQARLPKMDFRSHRGPPGAVTLCICTGGIVPRRFQPPSCRHPGDFSGVQPSSVRPQPPGHSNPACKARACCTGILRHRPDFEDRIGRASLRCMGFKRDAAVSERGCQGGPGPARRLHSSGLVAKMAL